jgi:hypothetical protein
MLPEELNEKMRRLHEANVRRTAGAEVKRELGALPTVDGLRRAAEMLWGRDDRIESMRLFAFLSGVHGMGQVKATTIVNALGVSTGDRRIRHLTDRQRDLLAGLLEERADAWMTRGVAA